MGDWILDIVNSMGYAGIAFLTFLENVFPPIPSELIMPLAGYEASRGSMTLPLAIAAGAIGSLLGSTCWFLVGRLVGERYLRRWVERHGRWLTIATADLDQAYDWFNRHGGAVVFFGRLIPGVRTLISVPAGLSCMSWTHFLIFSCLGTTLWTALLTGAGYWLGASFEEIEKPVGWVSNAVLALTVVWYFYRLATYPRTQH